MDANGTDKSDWIHVAIAKTKEQCAGVESVWSAMESLLKGKLSERQLPPSELSVIAEELMQKETAGAEEASGK